MKKLVVVMVALLLSVVAAWAGALDDAEAAYLRGDYATALQIYRPLVAQGDALAQFDLGVMYRDGQGVTQDYAEAVKWERLAAAQGLAGAQNNLGKAYHEGQGVKSKLR